MIVRVLNSEWEAERRGAAWILKRADGRCVRVSQSGVEECSRDGKETPLAVFSNGSEMLARVELLAAPVKKGRG